MKKKLSYKIVNYIKVYKFELQHFFIRYIFFCLIKKKNTIDNSEFNFLTIICKIRKQRKKAKLFVSIRSTNFF